MVETWLSYRIMFIVGNVTELKFEKELFMPPKIGSAFSAFSYAPKTAKCLWKQQLK